MIVAIRQIVAVQFLRVENSRHIRVTIVAKKTLLEELFMCLIGLCGLYVVCVYVYAEGK